MSDNLPPQWHRSPRADEITITESPTRLLSVIPGAIVPAGNFFRDRITPFLFDQVQFPLAGLPLSDVLLYVNGIVQDTLDYFVTEFGGVATLHWVSGQFELDPADRLDALYQVTP